MTIKTQKQTGKNMQQNQGSSWQNLKVKTKDQAPANDERMSTLNMRHASEMSHHFQANKPNKLMVRKRKHSQQPLRQLRTQRDLTLHKLAEVTGLSSSYLSRLESGTRRFNVEVLQKLAHALSCSVSSLLPLESQDPKGTGNMHRVDFYDPHNMGANPRSNAPDLPLYQLKSSEDQSCVLELESPSGWINRPYELQGVHKAISFQVNENYNGHRYRPGDQIFAHPSRPLSQNCSVLAITEDNRAFIGEFIGWSSQKGTDDWMILRSYEPSNTKEHSNDDLVHVPGDTMKAVYRIIGSFEAA